MFKLTIKDNSKRGEKRVVRDKKFADRNAAVGFYEQRYGEQYLENGLLRFTYRITN